jgi:serine/threonine protein kinase
MPPEYLKGIITPMSDIFSLGVIICEIITGHRDYPDDIRKSSTVFIERVRYISIKMVLNTLIYILPIII